LKRFLAATVVLVVTVAGFVWLALPPKHSLLTSAFPDGTIPGILHVHSTRSDGRGTVDDIARAAAAAGLRFVVLTDHGDGARAPDPPSYRNGVLCLDAVEISTTGGHYIALDLPKAPYPLGGEARDVADDVKRLGGFGIVAHPDSPKLELRWREWSAPFDAIEFVNLDTIWRQQMGPAMQGRVSRPSHLLLLRLLSYPFRPAESMASLIQPTQILDQWAEQARRRRVALVAGADAHAQVGWKLSDPVESRLAVSFPSYESSFRTLSVHVRPERPLTGNAVPDAALLIQAIRSGHLYIAVDGVATPPAFEFSATNALGTAREGDRLPPGGPVTLRVRSNAPPAFSITVWDGATLLAGNHHEQDFSTIAPGVTGIYRVEIRSTEQPGVPWIIGNPIYVRAPDSTATSSQPQGPGRRPPSQSQPLLGPGAPTEWHVEQDVTSRGAVDLPAMPPDSTGAVGRQARLRFGLSTGPAAGQFVALVADLGSGIGLNDRVSFTVRAERPMRISVQLRSDHGRWQRSIYVDTVDQERTVFFDDVRPAAGSTTDIPPRAEIRSLLFVVDTTNTRPGTSGRLWIMNPALQR
jgi:hypothetical protein